MGSKGERWIKTIYYALDITALVLAGLIAVGLRFSFQWEDFHTGWYGLGLLFILTCTIMFMYLNKLYDLRYKSWFVQVPKIVNSYVYAVLIFTLLTFYIREISFSRLALGYFSIAAVLLLLLGRFLTIYIIKRLYQRGIGIKKLLCVGMNERGLSILNYLDEHREFGYELTGYIEEYNKKIKKTYSYLGTIEAYKEIIEGEGIDALLISSSHNPKIREIIEFCEEKYIQVYMIPDILSITSNPVDIGQISTIPLIKFKEGALSPLQVKLKRIFDLTASSLAMILLSPVFLFIMLIIRVTTKSSVFFVQQRYGMNGEIIEVIKFRTMVENAEEVLEELIKNNPMIREEYNTYRKLKDDPRITPIGRFLRKTSLDELPQLINIIRGDISIVGPRPMLRDEMEKYGKYGKLVLKVKPGLTGLWQVSGRNNLPFTERVRLDMYYINNWSFWLDFLIILKTIPAVLERKGAN